MDQKLEWLKESLDRYDRKIDRIIEELASNTAETRIMKELQAKQNGNVARLQTEMNEIKQTIAHHVTEEAVWQTNKDNMCRTNCDQLVTIKEAVESNKLSNQTIIRVTVIVCVAAITIFGAKWTGALEALVKLLIG